MFKQRKKKNSKLLTLVLILVGIIYGLFSSNFNETYSIPTNNEKVIPTGNITKNATDLKIYFIDVGQADCILIQNKDENLLIDAGNNNDGQLLVEYFKYLGIDNFKYVIATHPHEDHIGGLDDIINNFTIKNLYMPDVITTTKTFEDVLEAMEDNNLSYIVPTIGDTKTLGDARLKFLYTGTDTSDLNNTSIVVKLIYGDTSFLFMGDATSKTEKTILNKNIESDVLKVGHHGSSYSSSNNFLDKVNPKYAVISVGKNNSYNHPSESTIEKLENRKIDIYRTDELGTILVTSNGKNIQINSMNTNTNGG